MEPPAKRARFGPAPLDDFDDPEADELNERPEIVNARRDPAVQLERSRAFAAFKLKSAFERIFEKYERDFTGVGDEIKLSTGEIVVDNGHIQSLKNAQLGAAEDGDGDGEASDAGSLNDEERMVRGKEDNRLSRLGQSPPLLMPPQIGTSPPPFFTAGWPGSTPIYGGTPGPRGVLYPGQMPLGGFPMHFATPVPMPTTDPAWKTPELPSPSARNALTWGKAAGSVRKKTARLSLSAAREQDGADEDDIFLDLFAAGDGEGKDERAVVKQRALLPRPPPEKTATKKKKRKSGGTSFEHAHEAKELREPRQHALKPLAQKKKGFQTKHVAAVEHTASVPSSEPRSEAMADVAELMPTDVAEATTPSVTEGARSESIGDLLGESEPVAVELPHTILPEPETELLDPADPDVYARLSDEGEEQRLIRKPANQTLRVEIQAGSVLDVRSFRILTPEPAEADMITRHGQTDMDGPSTKDKRVAKVQDTEGRFSDSMTVSGGKNQPRAMPTEVFTRNLVDPAYAFSDEDEPALPRRRESQRKPSNSKRIRSTNAEDAVLREISRNVGSGTANGDASHLQQVESAAARELSPTLSLHLDDLESCTGSGGKKPVLGGRVGPPQSLLAKTSQHTDDQPEKTPEGRVRSRLSREQAENTLVVTSESMAGGSKAHRNTSNEAEEAQSVGSRRRSRPRGIRPHDTPARASRSPDSQAEISLSRPTTQEIPETSPNAQPALRSPESVPLSPILETIDLNPPSPSAEHAADAPEKHDDRAPSPTLTDPTSNPQPPSPPRPKPPKPRSSNPHTPAKTPSRRPGPNRRQGTAPSTTTAALTKPIGTTTKPASTTTTTIKTKTRKGVLSLLPADNDKDNDDDDYEGNYEDELSVISPLRPPATVRSTPATHHVRLGLLAPPRSGGGGGGSRSVAGAGAVAGTAAGKNKKKMKGTTASVGGGAGAGLLFRTPSGRKRTKGSGGISGVFTGPGTPASSSRGLGESEELLVQTPGGTMRRCGEGGFRCEREFCFSCL
ncbi:hypothetical protein N658DRAFT_49278 [Parathielavia hyrcaniae]|uniref:Uncharacterized protein n=1 Tax=Parathielavia hyrcaniae TaxID=113614 RepID=A0AAN6Q3J8_9PEZI|nr:hypothetical protein N658DRAFT_49278 [Parathielavia hyrcaniae]